MKTKKVSKLKKKLDSVFSKWIQKRDSFICFTCNGKANQAGHYFSRAYTNLRFDETNVNAQCVQCNIFKKGNIAVYRMRLAVKYGNSELKRLETTYNKERRFTINELETLIKRYENP